MIFKRYFDTEFCRKEIFALANDLSSVLTVNRKGDIVDQFHFTIFIMALILYGLYALMIESVAALWLIVTDWCQDLSLGTHLLAKQVHSVGCQHIYCGWYACWLASHRVMYWLCLWQFLKLSQKSFRSSGIESQIINVKLKNNQQKVPGRPPKLWALDWQTCGNSNTGLWVLYGLTGALFNVKTVFRCTEILIKDMMVVRPSDIYNKNQYWLDKIFLSIASWFVFQCISLIMLNKLIDIERIYQTFHSHIFTFSLTLCSMI